MKPVCEQERRSPGPLPAPAPQPRLLPLGPLWLIWLICVLSGIGLSLGFSAGTPLAGQSDPRLPELFDQLAQAESEVAAFEAESEIWRIWHDAGDDEMNERMARGVRAMNAGNLRTAIEIFGEMIERDPQFAEGWNKRATAYYQLRDYEASIRDVEVVLRLEPRHFAAISGMGLIYSELHADAPALYWFERALRVHPYLRGVRERVAELRERMDRDRI